MRVSFLSIDEDFTKVHFDVEAVQDNDKIIFVDKSYENTTLHFKRIDTCVVMERYGDVTMKMVFDSNNQTVGFYKNSEGLEFTFFVVCTKLEWTDKKIKINYDMILDKQTRVHHKLSLLLYETLAK